MVKIKCLFDQWEANIQGMNLSNFQEHLFCLYMYYADGINRRKIREQWPEYFEGTEFE